MELFGKVALITGSARGIGKAIALELANHGAKIVINDILPKNEIDKTLEEIRKSGDQAIGIRADITIFKEVESMVKEIINKFGKIDILVNNAGIIRDSLLIRMKEEDWDTVININLKGTFNCSKTVAKYMLRQKSGGKIVNISSVIGLVGNIGQANYAASKAGIIGLTKSIAKELALRNINVNAIAPGFIETDMTKRLSEKVIKDLQQQIPLKRLGTVKDIAKVVYFLVSDNANYITGQVINVDGGMVM
ncbi:MAG: 3-oxoacyl-ACP reductase [Candidatus Infernicultor aquiphilus]|uniref:3-oxoacyl-[acyl-carrier-protein] reductase n=1 Tax=Candidatus Infernicultor aquiphilus TaxID=1805029 RepID=A0A1J5GRM6_9BACT|nr:3-oxoacyl-[acyl-carrier-protein] reductase [bacterium]OIP70494.1 MAG: 3-oxoacyl-[acyl-carrier-protein] reductase [Candidatus Atribacteria bacterium CG2_30_33_13]PIU25358.1 MAG: 3-oxoacyl-ACP reductase [Candidatus Atribacteria bacterium CG08_land_8_20_14_0_20_33_29]PIW11613.1 MAG: 3-oxoacyl-ACP reductase [Candidatus Atribacteria bacterium CG17_big_fil_post_rev_8_21_14_2_50_34_11]PIX34754.1 MAG: 3-oxoacyl-ACP reductase [Candidatus Atribacteria bacterium CG_4_8_14_3_um_filter_34_18]PIY33586.1 